MNYIKRLIEDPLKNTLQNGKSVLLLGARQTGKTTLLKHLQMSDISYTLLDPELRLRLEKSPNLLRQEILGYAMHSKNKQPLVIIDEVQKVPALMDVIQLLIDNQEAQFILTGSSVRKLRRHSQFNLLPGRVINFHLDPLSLLELPASSLHLESLLLYGSLPGIYLDKNVELKQAELKSYVTNYLEEEIRGEALVRQLASFSQFLELATSESGKQINFSKLSQDLGISRHTITEYFSILEDCLIVDKIEAITQTSTRRRLTKSVKYLFFDMGICRVLSGQGVELSSKVLGEMFEHYVGLELLRLLRLQPQGKLRFWRDHAGPEVDYVIEMGKQYIPIEVKWTDSPKVHDVKHLVKFMSEYPCQELGYIICRCDRPLLLQNNILALPWKQLDNIFIEH